VDHPTQVGQVYYPEEGVERLLVTSFWARLSIEQLSHRLLGYLLLLVFDHGQTIHNISRGTTIVVKEMLTLSCLAVPQKRALPSSPLSTQMSPNVVGEEEADNVHANRNDHNEGELINID